MFLMFKKQAIIYIYMPDQTIYFTYIYFLWWYFLKHPDFIDTHTHMFPLLISHGDVTCIGNLYNGIISARHTMDAIFIIHLRECLIWSESE